VVGECLIMKSKIVTIRNLMYLLEVVLIFLMFAKNQESVLLWVTLLLGVQLSFDKGNEGIFLETLDDYPDTERIKPRIHRFLYAPLFRLSDKGIPKELHFSGLVRFWGFLIYTAIFFTCLLQNKSSISMYGLKRI